MYCGGPCGELHRIGARDSCGKVRQQCQLGQLRKPVPDDRQGCGSGPAGRYGYRSWRDVSRMGQAPPRRPGRKQPHHLPGRGRRRRADQGLRANHVLGRPGRRGLDGATAAAVLRRLQPLCAESLRRLAPLRRVAAPRRRLPGRRGILREEDSGGGETASRTPGVAGQRKTALPSGRTSAKRIPTRSSPKSTSARASSCRPRAA